MGEEMTFQKYHAKKTVIDGIKFSSKLEADRFLQLKMLSQTEPPLISDLELQPEFQISEGYIDPETGEKHKNVFYVGDFKYVDNETHKTIVEDTKGVETDAFKLKWKLVQKRYKQIEFRKLTRKDV